MRQGEKKESAVQDRRVAQRFLAMPGTKRTMKNAVTTAEKRGLDAGMAVVDRYIDSLPPRLLQAVLESGAVSLVHKPLFYRSYNA